MGGRSHCLSTAEPPFPAEPAVDELVIADPGGFGGAGNDPVGAGGGAMAGTAGTAGIAGGGPCLPPIDGYEPNQPPIARPPVLLPF